MLFLTSNGLSSNRLIERLKEECKALSNAVIITTASVGYKEKDRHIPRLTEELNLLGLTVDYFDFDVQVPELLLKYDVIVINGGNPFYLLNSMRNSNCQQVLEKLVLNKIVIGISAGSIVMQKNINLIAQYSPEMNDGIDLIDLKGFAFTDVEILPHYSRFLEKFERFEERAKAHEIKNNCQVIRINDGEGVLVSSEGFVLI